MTDTAYKLTYFPIRGLAEQARLLMHDQGIPFEDVHVTEAQWPALKPTMQFGQMPCLTDGSRQFKIVQSGAIMRHLGRKHDLYGDTEWDHTFVDMVFEGVKDLHIKYSKLIYTEYEEKKEEFVQKVLPVELGKFDSLLKMNQDGNGFIGGDKITFADYTLFEELDIMQLLDAGCLDSFATLKGFYERMANLPNLQQRLNQRQLDKLPVNGNGKQ